MKLYFSPGACSLAPHIVARELGLKLDLEKVDLAARKTERGEDYFAINPKGYVPALRLDDGSVLTEVSAILQYLADRKPEAKLIPAFGTMERYRVLEWVGFIATEIHKGFGPLWKPDTPDAYKAIARENLARRFLYIESQLGQDYLTGSQFTIADAYAFTTISWANYLKVDLAPYAKLRAFLARVAARPGVQAAMLTEGLIKEAVSA
jgi:glutathione S-transferase